VPVIQFIFFVVLILQQKIEISIIPKTKDNHYAESEYTPVDI
jgi:hypothetical protein